MPCVLTFSSVDWHYLWHRPQAVMSRLAEDNWRVLYVDTLGLRSPRLRDLPRIISRLRRRVGASVDGLHEPLPGLHVFSPLLLPFLNSRIARRLNVGGLLRRLSQHMQHLGGRDPVIWVYLPTWTVLQCVTALPHSLLVYEAIDALANNPSGVSKDFHVAEKEILLRADLVITSSESLCLEKVTFNPNTHWVPSGVAEIFFAPQSPAAEMQAIPGPRIGFFGTLDHRLDLNLMGKLATDNPDWSFVLIGPARCDVDLLTGMANVHWLGAKSHEELPGYLSGLDVIYLPYVIDEFTRHIYPAKIHECLAMGVPVVATALPALLPFDGVVRLVRPGESFAAELSAALSEDDPELRQQRKDLARANSWEVGYGEIRTLVEEAISKKAAGE